MKACTLILVTMVILLSGLMGEAFAQDTWKDSFTIKRDTTYAIGPNDTLFARHPMVRPEMFRFRMPRTGVLMRRFWDPDSHAVNVHPFLLDDFHFDADHLALHGLRDAWEGLETEEFRELNQLESEARRLARRVREAPAAERSPLEAELDQKLQELFERRQELRRQRVHRLEEQLAAERHHVADRDAARQEIIERRKRDLLQERDPLAW